METSSIFQEVLIVQWQLKVVNKTRSQISTVFWEIKQVKRGEFEKLLRNLDIEYDEESQFNTPQFNSMSAIIVFFFLLFNVLH